MCRPRFVQMHDFVQGQSVRQFVGPLHPGCHLAGVHPAGSSLATTSAEFPGRLGSETELDEELTRPSAALVAAIRQWASPLVLIGAGGKMGPTLAVLALRAAEAARHPLEVVAVSRFGNHATRDWLEARRVRTIACDLFDPAAVIRLPDTANLIHLVGLKFGTATNPGATWAANTLVPARVCERYPAARVVALSTANVYPLTAAVSNGADEAHPLDPVGEYPNAAVARERIFQFQSHRQGTPVALLRLSYAVDLRYGVLADIARHVQRGDPVELANGWFNCIWQGDASDLILRSLALATNPPTAFNLCAPAVLSVRDVATRLGTRLGRPAKFTGQEADTALLSNPAKLCAELGPPPTPLEDMLRWTADWVKRGGRDLNRPTHFEVRDGRY